ncbi:hypothetical protein [Hyphobacterium sp.]|uniref:hypothetical protein n=1 Tax=Hyphobacterium sp. TaxID=2004662 RepID=UPI003BAD14F3
MGYNVLIAAGLASAAIAAAFSGGASAQSVPQFDRLPFANDTSWAGVEYHGNPVGAYGPNCTFALQMDFRRMQDRSRELVVQTACENLENAEMNFIVPEGQTGFESNLPHPGANFYDVSADGREIRFVRVFDPAAHNGISRDRVRIRVNQPMDSATIFWEVRQNNQWRTIGYAVATKLLNHNVYRPVPDEGVPPTAAARSFRPDARDRRRPRAMAVRPINETASNLVATPSWMPLLNQGIAIPLDFFAQNTHDRNDYDSDAPTPGLGGRPAARQRN